MHFLCLPSDVPVITGYIYSHHSSAQRSDPLPPSWLGHRAHSHCTHPWASRDSAHQHLSRKKKASCLLFDKHPGKQTMIRYHPGSSKAAWEYKKPKRGGQRIPAGGWAAEVGTSTAKAAAEDAAGEDVTRLAPALHCMAGVASCLLPLRQSR